MGLLPSHALDGKTLAEARPWLEEQAEEGIDCPLCTRYVKIYRRKLSSCMARALLALVRHAMRTNNEWFDLTQVLKRVGISAANSNAALLRYWNLLEPAPEPTHREDGSPHVGIYRVTPLGFRFARGEVELPRRVIIYDHHILGFTDEHTSIRDALGDKFRYDELMGWAEADVPYLE